jgi:hypothetical protein
MVISMNKNYCMVNVETSICDNICLWDGNPDTWTPPSGYLMLPQATTPAKNWVWIDNAWVIANEGEGQIGFTWDGTYLTTNEPEPENAAITPDGGVTTGAKTL